LRLRLSHQPPTNAHSTKNPLTQAPTSRASKPEADGFVGACAGGAGTLTINVDEKGEPVLSTAAETSTEPDDSAARSFLALGLAPLVPEAASLPHSHVTLLSALATAFTGIQEWLIKLTDLTAFKLGYCSLRTAS
jgi:hypothetical protein